MSGRGLRITGGRWGGRRLPVPARDVRPTEGRVREALFSMWQDRVPDSSFLDLFAGSGAVGIEAISRGARRVVAMEGAAGPARALRAQVADEPEFRVQHAQLPRALRTLPAEPFDLIFADPPYRFGDYAGLLRCCAPWLAPSGELALEHAHDVPAPDDPALLSRLVLDRARRYGSTQISFYRHPTDIDVAAAR